MNAFRLPAGGLIDRAKPLRFSFDGVTYDGCDGDTLASALLANGVHLVGRSFKYHRPRGIVSAGPEEPNALVTLGAGADATPNAVATTTWLRDGLQAKSQNRWPSLRYDFLSINALLSPFFPAGFYYKTFMWPAAFWERLYEPLIRRAAGMGALSGAPDPDRYDEAHAFCDLLVIGAGPAGLSAALAGARAGLRVLLVERDRALGGRLLSERHEIDGADARSWVRAVEGELGAASNVQILRNASLFAAYDHGAFAALQAHTLWKIFAKRAVLTTGAYERPLVFGGNDKPGVMLAGAMQSYAQRFAVAPGARIAVFTCADSGWRAAADMADAGCTIAAVIDPRDAPPASYAEKLKRGGAQLHLGACVSGTYGSARVRGVDIRDARGEIATLDVDALAMGGGWSPAIGIGCHLGARPVWREDIHAFALPETVAHVAPAGAAHGAFSLGDALRQGAAAGRAAVEALGKTPAAYAAPIASDDAVALTPLWRVKESRGKAFVDFQNDVTASDIDLAAREGFRNLEHLKRYTTLGMGSDQGKTSNANGFAILAEINGAPMAGAGAILARPPESSVPIAAFAGTHRDEDFRPTRFTPSHDWAVEQGAVFTDAGEWKRAQWYPRAGESDWLQSVSREAAAVRAGVGVCDVSTLGKIEVIGPDAGALLDRLYTSLMSNLAVGRMRYGLMLREDGFALDDGSVTRLGPEHFFVTTTTANAARVMQHMDFCAQALWPELDVATFSATEQWAQYAVAGPRARVLLQRLMPDAVLSNAAFPYMAAGEFIWRGVRARLYRLSFSGELAYEIAVPATNGDALIRALFDAGADLGVTAYGTEALGVLRIEKGHAAGGEFSGQTTAHDLGLQRLLSRRKDFIGRAMAGRAALTDVQRPALVGLKPTHRATRLIGGGHIVPLDVKAPGAAHDLGYVTSAAFSPHLGHWIALALVRNGPQRIGERLRFYDPVRGGDAVVEVCAPVFIDPAGERVRG